MQLLNNASRRLREMLAKVQAMEAEVDANLKTRIDNLENTVEGLDVGEVRGEPGKSAYQIWLDQGNTGSQTDFINSLKIKGDPGNQGNPGRDGTNGTNGVDGAPGQNATDAQVEAKVNDWLTAHPPAKGDRGEQGIQGVQGNPGPKGDPGTAGTNGTNGTNGSNGAAATVQIGTVTTGAAGSSATVTNAGTSSAAILNFTIPRGNTGNQGVSGDSRVKFAAQNEFSNASGVYTKTFAANLFTKSPAIFITPRTNTPLFLYGVTTTGTAATGFTVTVTFLKIKASLAILGSLTEATVGAVNFDIQAVEPD